MHKAPITLFTLHVPFLLAASSTRSKDAHFTYRQTGSIRTLIVCQLFMPLPRVVTKLNPYTFGTIASGGDGPEAAYEPVKGASRIRYT
jgi:hypothetical protein